MKLLGFFYVMTIFSLSLLSTPFAQALSLGNQDLINNESSRRYHYQANDHHKTLSDKKRLAGHGATASAGARGGGHPETGNTNGGDARPQGQGGAGVIPFYAAAAGGAARNGQHNRHNGGNRVRSKARGTAAAIVAITALASLALGTHTITNFQV